MNRRPWDAGRSRVGRDRGSGTVLVLGAVGAILLALVGALQVVAAVVASHRAQSAADLAALAGAAIFAHGGSDTSACVTAARVAALNAATLTACRVDGSSAIVVTVSVPVRGPALAGSTGQGPASARSRAGPAP